jgi:3-phosphoglycerate kinase
MGEMRNAYKFLSGISQGKVYLLEDLRFHKRKSKKIKKKQKNNNNNNNNNNNKNSEESRV